MYKTVCKNISGSGILLLILQNNNFVSTTFNDMTRHFYTSYDLFIIPPTNWASRYFYLLVEQPVCVFVFLCNNIVRVCHLIQMANSSCVP